MNNQKVDNSKLYFKSTIKAKAVSFAQPDYSAVFTSLAPPSVKKQVPKQ
jgi:hypothetical protein